MGDTDGPPRIDEHDRQVGLERLRALRVELGPSPAAAKNAGDDRPVAKDSASRDLQLGDAIKNVPNDVGYEPPTVDATLTVDRMNAEMSAAAEREHLERRVATLEAEVAHLRRALAEILRTAASAVTGPVEDTAGSMTARQDHRGVDQVGLNP